MKKIIFPLLLAAAVPAGAVVTPVNVADSTVQTVSGIGGYAEVSYAFAKGDKITLVAGADKRLERVMVVMLPQTVLLRIKDTRKAEQTFEMPADGTVVIRFVSDRAGVNSVHYRLVRVPGSEAVQDYN